MGGSILVVDDEAAVRDLLAANLQRAGTSRGTVVAALTDALFADLASGAADPVARYRDYLAARDASYMQLESGAETPRVKPDWAELSGYDRIALMTISAIAGNTGAVTHRSGRWPMPPSER